MGINVADLKEAIGYATALMMLLLVAGYLAYDVYINYWN